MFLLGTVLLAGALGPLLVTSSPWQNPSSNQFHIQTDDGPERYFRYQTDNGQYRKEKRLHDGTVIGTYAWIDDNGYLRQRDYIADDQGYRITKNQNIFVGRNVNVGEAVKATKKVSNTNKASFKFDPFPQVPNTGYISITPKHTYTTTSVSPSVELSLNSISLSTPIPILPETSVDSNNLLKVKESSNLENEISTYPGIYLSSSTSTHMSFAYQKPGNYPAGYISSSASNLFSEKDSQSSETPAILLTSKNDSNRVDLSINSPRTYEPIVTTTMPPFPVSYLPPSLSTTTFESTSPSSINSATKKPNLWHSPKHSSYLSLYGPHFTSSSINHHSSTPDYIDVTSLSRKYKSQLQDANFNSIKYSGNTEYQDYSHEFVNPYIHQNGPTYPIDTKGRSFNPSYNNIGNGYNPQYPYYDGISVTNDGFRYYIPRAYHEEQNTVHDQKSGSFGYVDPFGIRRVIYYNAGPSGFKHKKNNRYVGLNGTPYDPRHY